MTKKESKRKLPFKVVAKESFDRLKKNKVYTVIALSEQYDEFNIKELGAWYAISRFNLCSKDNATFELKRPTSAQKEFQRILNDGRIKKHAWKSFPDVPFYAECTDQKGTELVKVGTIYKVTHVSKNKNFKIEGQARTLPSGRFTTAMLAVRLTVRRKLSRRAQMGRAEARTRCRTGSWCGSSPSERLRGCRRFPTGLFSG